jgi:hypothetical protein
MFDILKDKINSFNIHDNNDEIDIYEELKYIFTHKFEYYFDLTDIIEGSYYGKQATLYISDRPAFVSTGENVISFELCWDYNNITIYTNNHNGFWVPPYSTDKRILVIWKKEFLESYLYLN